MTVFERILDGSIPGRIIERGERVSVLLDIRPTTKGHLLVIPNEPFVDIHTVPDPILCEMVTLAQTMAAHVVERLNAQGVNLVMNNGAIAGQQVFHAHIHVIPRYENDGLASWHGNDADPEELDEVLAILKSV